MAGDKTLSELIRDAITARLQEVYTATVCRVKTYNNKEQTADLIPMIRQPIEFGNGEFEYEEVCVLPDVPVVWPRVGDFFIHLPLAEGDHVLALFCHESIEMWRETGGLSDPGDLRRHDLSHGVAIAGLFPSAKPLSTTEPDLAARAAGLVLGKDGSDAQLHATDDAILVGRGATIPIAKAPPILDVFAALLAWVNEGSPRIPGSAPQIAALEALRVTLASALGTAATDTAATIGKVK